MPCLPLIDRSGSRPRRIGFVCFRNEPVEIAFGGRTYQFEWTGWCGWMPINLDGSQRLTRVPNGAWDVLLARQAERAAEAELEKDFPEVN